MVEIILKKYGSIVIKIFIENINLEKIEKKIFI